MTLSIQFCYGRPTGHAVINGPVGRWWLEWCDAGLLAAAPTDARPQGNPLPEWLAQAWEAFWAGRTFELKLCTMKPMVPFFEKVYQQISRVLPGEVISYRDVAERCGSPRAVKAVAHALQSNPWPLFVPEHRVVAEIPNLLSSLNHRRQELCRQLLQYEQVALNLADEIGQSIDFALERVKQAMQNINWR